MTLNSEMHGSAGWLIATWVLVFIGFAAAGPLGAVGGAAVGDKLARKIDLGDSRGKYIGE